MLKLKNFLPVQRIHLRQTFIKEHIGLSSVYGATLENNHVYHKRITTFEEVPMLMNSKYIQSETVGIWKNIKDDLKQGYWVLFSGTPCQVAALYAYLGKERNHERLLTIEVVCHGVASQEALDIHLQHFHSKKIYSFRNKEEGQGWITSQCTTIERDGHSYRFIRKEDVFYKIFASWLLDRKSCSNCQYSSLNRVADITLADFWGGARDFREYELGVNVIVANNSKADTFVRGSKDLEVYGSTLYKAINSNSNFYNGYKYIQYHPFVLWANFSRKILPRRLWLQIAENRMPWKLFWAVYKVMTILHVKRRKKLIERQYGNILHEWLSGGVQY